MKKRIEKIFLKFQSNNTFPKTELIFNSPFELLISVILSAKSRDINVNNITKKLFFIANNPYKMLNLGEKKLKKYIKSIGLYNMKSKNIIKTCNILLNKYNNKIPNNRIELEKLPGIGRKSANIILNIIFGFPTIAVDTHVFRISNRTKIATGKTVSQVEKKLLKVVPKKFQKNCHQWLVLHGKKFCLAKKPNCKYCIINKFCKYEKKLINKHI